jgi:hypothetical protein
MQRWLLAPLVVALAIGGNLLSECCALVELCREDAAGSAPACCSAHTADAATVAGGSCHGFRAMRHGDPHAPADSCGCRAHEDSCAAELTGPPALAARDPNPVDVLAPATGPILEVAPASLARVDAAPLVAPGGRPLYRLIARIRC